MADIPVKQKGGVPWWVWLVGLLVLIGVLWYFFAGGDRNRVVGASDPVPAASSAVNPPPIAASPAATSAIPAGTAESSSPITDPDVYASSADKLSLVGRQAALTGVKVIRVVGPKTFTISSGGDELFVMVDQDLSQGVGSQGQIAKDQSLNVKGTFQRLQQDEISDISNSRFRELTELERETLRKTQVYLHATEFGKLS